MQKLAAYGFILFLLWFGVLGPLMGGLTYSSDRGELVATDWFQATGVVAFFGFIGGAIIYGFWQKWRGDV